MSVKVCDTEEECEYIKSRLEAEGATWYIQYLGIKESTNTRRLMSGIAGGYGIMGIQIIFVKYIAQYL